LREAATHILEAEAQRAKSSAHLIHSF
jgi:hypothetical protein